MTRRGRTGGRPKADGAVRAVWLLGAALLLAVVAAVVVLTTDTDPDDEPADELALPTSLGPTAGTPVADYVAAQRPLATGIGDDDRRVAVLSLVSYRSVAAVDDFLGGIAGPRDLEVAGRLVALPGGAPATVLGALDGWIDEQRVSLQGERDEIAGLLPTIEDPADPFVAGYTEDLARLDAQLGRLDAAGEVVFGAVVVTTGDVLEALATRPEVRVLAVGPGAEVGDADLYRGVRPEETELAGTPDTRPLPP